ncbi:MAG TPA: hypothetical protein VIK89_11455 [Cytophagaceae bacterium]
MQRYGELKHLLNEFNELIFGCGFYYYWAKDHKRAMRTNKSSKAKGDVLVIYSMFDPSYAHQIEIYFKQCTEHNLPEDYHIPDHWTKPPFEILSIVFATEEENEDDNLVKEFVLKLNCHTFQESDYFWIKASRFYFNKLEGK